MITNGRIKQTSSHGNQTGLVDELRSFLGHARQLASLQGRLFARDVDESRSRLVRSLVSLAVGGLVFAGCIPVLMVAAGLLLANLTPIGLGWCLMIVVGVGLAVSITTVLIALRWMRASWTVFDRSREELGKNLDSLFGDTARVDQY